MNKPISASAMSLSRRQVMIGAAGLSFAVALRGQADAAVIAAERSGQAMSPWVSIAPDGTITIMSAATEMGQGSMTSLPLILAEELDADWDKVRIVPAPVNEAIYGNPGFGGLMYTAGSNAVTSYYNKLRVFGAQVRRVLIDNAAKQLGVPAAELTTEPSVVVHAKSGRKLGYGEIAAKAEIPAQAPEVKPEELKKPSQFRLITKDVMRAELPLKVNGSAKYSIDTQLPGMLYGAVLRAPVEGAKPEGFDEAKVVAIKGVVKAVALPYGVGVVAETPWAAFAGRNIVERSVRWSKDGKAWGFDSDKGLATFAATARDPNAQATDWFKLGDVRTEMPKAAATFEQEYLCDYAYHAQMEPLNGVASVSPAGDSAEVWCGTQSQSIAAEATANALGIDRAKVTLHDTLIGGGFGRRGPRDMDFLVDAVLLSKVVKRPVKSMWTREDDVHNGRFRPLSAHLLRAGFDGSGKLMAWHHRLVGDRVTPFIDPVRYAKAGKKDFILMLGADAKGYDVAHQLVEQVYEDTGVRTAPLRGIGFTANKFATETFVDELAYRANMDPVAYRLALLAKTPRGHAVLQRAAEMADWSKKREGTALGAAYIDYSGTQIATVVELSVDRKSGKVKLHNIWCAIDCGVPVQPDNVVAQTQSSLVYGIGLALTERISIKDGAVEQSNFYDYIVSRNRDVPPLHIAVIPTDNHPTGVGQMATPTVTPAVSNALMALTKVRLRHAPFTEERVKKALA
ncbi:MAG TPA: molybdopterin cofactor-binding domain-containing protein [Pseudolabrys sp.]|nr:molybdopterin cofactor-binding domain-containing protein [Pseudolabrys sp.]